LPPIVAVPSVKVPALIARLPPTVARAWQPRRDASIA
jgi:hypothetical protein